MRKSRLGRSYRKHREKFSHWGQFSLLDKTFSACSFLSCFKSKLGRLLDCNTSEEEENEQADQKPVRL